MERGVVPSIPKRTPLNSKGTTLRVKTGQYQLAGGLSFRSCGARLSENTLEHGNHLLVPHNFSLGGIHP